MSENKWQGPILGQFPDGERERDAIHIAVIPVRAAEPLGAGHHVGVTDGKASRSPPLIGVVDPFLTPGLVEAGEWFWLLLYPGTITSLRHEWIHPAFPLGVRMPAGDTAASQLWLKAFAADHEISYWDLIDGAVSGDGATFGTDHETGVQSAEFWQHIAVVTGKTFSAGHIDNTYFGCAC